MTDVTAEELATRVSNVVRFSLPQEAVIAVLNHGDELPLKLGDRQIVDFSQGDPSDGQGLDAGEEIARLDSLRKSGVEYLVVPRTAEAWLEHRPALRLRLEQDFRRVRDEQACAIFALNELVDPLPEHGSAADGFPLPPPELVRLVAGYRNPDRFYERFYETGVAVANRIREMAVKNGIEMRDFETLLDFGCGCGRVIRQWRSLAGTDLHGTDYNPYLIEWCRRHLPFASFTTNELSPRLSYEDETFDFVYAISIFTHLDEPLQVPWMSELRRVTKPGGFMMVTLNGASKLERLGEDQLGAEERQRFAAGALVVLRSHLPGTTACAAFHPERYVHETLARDLAVIDLVPGGTMESLRQDVLWLQKPDE